MKPLILRTLLAAPLLLSGCVGGIADRLSAWQDSLFVTPPPTEAQIKEAMTYVGAADLPMPHVTVADRRAMDRISQGSGYTVLAATIVIAPSPLSRYGNPPTFGSGGQALATMNGASIILGPSWNLNGGGEALLVHEAYNYARAKRGLTPDDCGAYRIEHQYEEMRGWYGQEHQTEGGEALAGCPVRVGL